MKKTLGSCMQHLNNLYEIGGHDDQGSVQVVVKKNLQSNT